MPNDTRPCPTCGTAMQRYRVFPKYCSVDCRPRCSVEGCEKPQHGNKQLCSNHEYRRRKYGDPEHPLLIGKNSGNCTVEGCDQPQRKRTWCASHYAQWKRTGVDPVPFKYKWSEYGPCLNCGKHTEGSMHRKYCSDNCRVSYADWGGPRPKTTPCVACGVDIDLNEIGKGGQRRHAVVKFCRPCKRDYNKYKMSAGELALRDGTDCGICGEPVDMTLRRSDGLMCASVDHVLPRSRGGTHDPENLQLAHLRCNMSKSDRVMPVT